MSNSVRVTPAIFLHWALSILAYFIWVPLLMLPRGKTTMFICQINSITARCQHSGGGAAVPGIKGGLWFLLNYEMFVCGERSMLTQACHNCQSASVLRLTRNPLPLECGCFKCHSHQLCATRQIIVRPQSSHCAVLPSVIPHCCQTAQSRCSAAAKRHAAFVI